MPILVVVMKFRKFMPYHNNMKIKVLTYQKDRFILILSLLSVHKV